MMLLTLKEAPDLQQLSICVIQSSSARNWQTRPMQIHKEVNAFLYHNRIHWTPNPISAFMLTLYRHKGLVCIAIGYHHFRWGLCIYSI